MRAREFVAEEKMGKLSARNRYATVGLDTFTDGHKNINNDYTLNRVMMAVACADGTDTPVEIDSESWVGKNRTAHPYTQTEQNMLKQAFKAAGAEWKDLNSGDLDSDEVKSTNTQSPVQGFGGFR
jgi:hypothetical protein